MLVDPVWYQKIIEKRGRQVQYIQDGATFNIIAKVPAELEPIIEDQITGGVQKDRTLVIMSALNLLDAGVPANPKTGDRLVADGYVYTVQTVDFAYDGDDVYGYRVNVSG